jgi:hypothetical protein
VNELESAVRDLIPELLLLLLAVSIGFVFTINTLNRIARAIESQTAPKEDSNGSNS